MREVIALYGQAALSKKGLVGVCVCEGERVCVCVCVRERERESVWEMVCERVYDMFVYVREMCVFVHSVSLLTHCSRRAFVVVSWPSVRHVPLV